MMQFLHAVFLICFILLALGFFIGNYYFLKVFERLKKEEPAYLDSKINKYAYLDSRSQFAKIILKGKYQDLKNQNLKKLLDKQRKIMILHLIILIICILSFLLSIAAY